MKKVFVFLAMAILLFAGQAMALDITLQWDANTEPDLAGYKVYYNIGSNGPPYNGTGAVEGNSPIDVGNVTTFTLHGLPDDSGINDQTYFVVTAYDNETPSLESGYSNEVKMWDQFTGTAPHAPVIIGGSYTLSNGTVVVINGDGSLTITLPGGEVVDINP